MKTSSILNSSYLTRIAAIASCLGLLLHVIVRLTVPPDAYETRLTRLSEIADDVEIITLGNSHSRSFHFASMNLTGFHFFEQNGDMEEMERRANIVIDLLPSLKYALISLSPGALSASQRLIADDYEARRLLIRKGSPFTLDMRSYSLEELIGTISYRLFRIESLQSHIYEILGYKTEKRTFDQMRTDNECFASSALQNSSALLYETPEEGIIDGYRRLVMDYDCLERYGDANSQRRRIDIDRSMNVHPHLLEENIGRLLTLAGKLEERGIALILVTTPNTPWYYDSDAISDLRPRFEAAIEDLTAHPNVRYFDFHDLYYDHLEAGKNHYFFDDNHLALYGAKMFSAYFAEKLDFSSGRDERFEHL